MKFLVFALFPLLATSASTTDNTQILQTNVNVQNVDTVSTESEAAVSPEVVPKQDTPVDSYPQLLKEANAQYQYQLNSRYEEKTRPVQDRAYPYYLEDGQYQETGNGQRRIDVILGPVRSPYERAYVAPPPRSQSFSEYGKGESSPDYNTYTYNRVYY